MNDVEAHGARTARQVDAGMADALVTRGRGNLGTCAASGFRVGTGLAEVGVPDAPARFCHVAKLPRMLGPTGVSRKGWVR